MALEQITGLNFRDKQMRIDVDEGLSADVRGAVHNSTHFEIPHTFDVSIRCLTCRILAGWPLRNSVTASRPSRHQSKNRPIFFARSRSSFVLKPLTVFAITESLSRIFHLDTTL